MTFFYDRFEFEQGSRLTGIWMWPWPGDPGADNVALVSQVRLGAGQDGSLECDFLSSHLPWAAGGVHGVGPEGDPWLVVVQMAPRAAAGELVGSVSPWWPMTDGIARALRLNPEAEIIDDMALTVDDLRGAFVSGGIPAAQIDGWATPDLLSGLLAECANVPLNSIVTGRVTGCAFPDLPHDCERDVFRDVFAAWAQGSIPAAQEPARPEAGDADENADEGELGEVWVGDEDWVDDEHSGPSAVPRIIRGRPLVWSWTRKRVKGWSTTRVRLQAVEDGWSAKAAGKASRKELVEYLTTPHCCDTAIAEAANLKPSAVAPARIPGNKMTEIPVRRITLATTHDYGISCADVAAWVGEALYVGHCDYGDSDETTHGFDIDEPLDLLLWLIVDRFSHDRSALCDYADRVGIYITSWWDQPREVTVGGRAGVQRLDGIEGIILAFPDLQGEKAAEITDWHGLTILLLADRCQGGGAWGRVEALCARAGVTTTRIDRGYV